MNQRAAFPTDSAAVRNRKETFPVASIRLSRDHGGQSATRPIYICWNSRLPTVCTVRLNSRGKPRRRQIPHLPLPRYVSDLGCSVCLLVVVCFPRTLTRLKRFVGLDGVLLQIRNSNTVENSNPPFLQKSLHWT